MGLTLPATQNKFVESQLGEKKKKNRKPSLQDKTGIKVSNRKRELTIKASRLREVIYTKAPLKMLDVYGSDPTLLKTRKTKEGKFA